jgi:hypothetical protein
MNSIAIRREVVVLVMFAAAVVAAIGFASTTYAVAGAIFTTDAGCVGTNENIFDEQSEVYLDGGPQHEGAAGLDDGTYFVQVTQPNGFLLGKSSTDVVTVTDGSFAECYQLSDILSKASDSTPGYDITTNGGGMYKVWVSKSDDFANSESKTDNFKVGPGNGNTCEQGDENCVCDESGNCGQPDPVVSTITVVKVVDNGNTGSLNDEDDFQMMVDGNGVDQGVAYEYEPGPHSVTESGPDLPKGYMVTYSDSCPEGVVMLLSGADVTCTVTNTAVAPKLTVTKVVTNDSGGTLDANTVPLFVDGNPIATEVQNSYTMGNHVVSETQQLGYEGTISGDCATNGSIALALGDVKSCTITNNDIPPTVSGFKFFDMNANGTWDTSLEPGLSGWVFNLAGPVTGSQTTAASGAYTFLDLDAGGPYTITETLKFGWTQTTPNPTFSLVLDQDLTSQNIGNACFVSTKGLSKGYWTNKNGETTLNDAGGAAIELAMLSALNLRSKNGAAFDPTTYSALKTWLNNAEATNMAYMLSAQLVAVELGVESGAVTASALVLAPGLTTYGLAPLGLISIADLMSAADAALGANGATVAVSLDRMKQEALKNVLDRVATAQNIQVCGLVQ